MHNCIWLYYSWELKKKTFLFNCPFKILFIYLFSCFFFSFFFSILLLSNPFETLHTQQTQELSTLSNSLSQTLKLLPLNSHLSVSPPPTRLESQRHWPIKTQSFKTRRGSMNNHNASLHFNEDLLFVTLEPLKDSMIILVEDGTNKDPQLLGHIVIPVSVIEKRLDEHHEASLPIFIFIFITYLHLHLHCPRRHPTLPICSGFRGFLLVSWWRFG